jgi:ATP-dependent Clp protease protease subunit
MNLGLDFEKYAKDRMGVSQTQLDAYQKVQGSIYGASASMTPYILEEREMRVTQMDIFSRLMRERILWVSGVVNDYMSNVVQAQLLYLQSVDSDDITMYINSPGGSVAAGLAMVDTMNLCKPDIKTVNTCLAASMGSILLGAGTKGKRLMLPNARVMLHQVSSGMQGNIQDIRITYEQSEKYNNKLFDMLAEYTGKDRETVMSDAQRDLWLDSEAALEYGIVDEIIGK